MGLLSLPSQMSPNPGTACYKKDAATSVRGLPARLSGAKACTRRDPVGERPR